MSETKEYWPFVLLMPRKHEDRLLFIRDILASRIAPSVLPCFESSGIVLQKDLIQSLNHSNKSIIQYLDAMRRYGLITTGTRVEKGKRIVFHEITKKGWALVRFFSKGMPTDVGKLTESLLEEYLSSIFTFYRSHNLDETAISEVISRSRGKVLMEDSVRHDAPEYCIFGASAWFTRIRCQLQGDESLETRCEMPIHFPGGPSLELASHLANSGAKTTFVSSVGDDLNGWNIVSALLRKGVDVSQFRIDHSRRTNETLLIEEEDSVRTYVGIDEGFSLSLDSPSQVPWDAVKSSKIVYIGEVFIEVAVSIASFCKANNIPLIFRCSQHYWNLGIQRIAPVLNQADVLLVSPQEWSAAKLQLGLNPMNALRKQTKAEALIKLDKTKIGLMTGEMGHLELFSYATLQDDLEPGFVADLLINYNETRDLEESLHRCFKE